jgi:tRNA modification GTPase
MMTNNPPPATIVALATAAGKAGVAVIRISGTQAKTALTAFTGLAAPKPRYAHYATFCHPATNETIDQGLALYFPAPHSFTGEVVVEFHLHGSKAVLNATLNALCDLPNIRLAHAGEFTKRAFQNDKLDLTQVEGLADLLDAETEKQRSQAVQQLQGALHTLYTGWQETLLKPLAYLEAHLDFPEEDIPDSVLITVHTAMHSVLDAMEHHLLEGQRGERLRDGIRIAIIGRPNVGKSSLLNALATREAAIVSPLAGTTRDIIEVCLDIGGYAVILADTAGLRDTTTDTIEQTGIARAKAWLSSADIVLFVADATVDMAEQLPLLADITDKPLLKILNKTDALEKATPPEGFIPLSVQTGDGFPALHTALQQTLEQLYGGQASAPLLTRTRHRHAALAATEALRRALQAPLPELMAEDLRHALHKLGELVGRYDVEAMLDIVFRDFCIGK